MKKALPDTEAIDVSILSQDKDFTYLFVICMKADAQNMEEVLRGEYLRFFYGGCSFIETQMSSLQCIQGDPS